MRPLRVIPKGGDMKTTGGKWHAFTTNRHEVRVVEMAQAQPWGFPTRAKALSFLRPIIQSKAAEWRREAETLEAALEAIDAMLEES